MIDNTQFGEFFKQFQQRMDVQPLADDMAELVSSDGQFLTIFELMTVFMYHIRKHVDEDFCVSVANNKEDKSKFRLEIMKDSMFQDFWTAFEEELNKENDGI